MRLPSVRAGWGKVMSFTRSRRSARDMTKSWLLLPDEKYMKPDMVAPNALVEDSSAWYFTITCPDC